MRLVHKPYSPSCTELVAELVQGCGLWYVVGVLNDLALLTRFVVLAYGKEIDITVLASPKKSQCLKKPGSTHDIPL